MSDLTPTDKEKALLAELEIKVQPAPVATDAPSSHDLVIADMQKRKEFGLRKYGQLLQAGNTRDALQDAYEEALDLTVYLRTAIEERNRANGTNS